MTSWVLGVFDGGVGVVLGLFRLADLVVSVAGFCLVHGLIVVVCLFLLCLMIVLTLGLLWVVVYVGGVLLGWVSVGFGGLVRVRFDW